MFTKHFFKVLIGFMGMILLGLFGLFLSDQFSTDNEAVSVQAIDR